jgi:hypothetical protein
MDFSVSNQLLVIQSNQKLAFFEVFTGKRKKNGAHALRNEDWFTWTCTVGWPVYGVY